MGIAEKLSKAKKTDWVSEGFSKAEVKTIVELAKISAQIERCRLEMSMTQQEFAKFMGVTQGMVSKWESREYNFTIKRGKKIWKESLDGISQIDAFPVLKARLGKSLPQFVYTLSPDKQTATLQIMNLYQLPQLKQFCDSVFSVINREHVPNLVIDVRNNKGGSSAGVDMLLSYLSHDAYTLYIKTDLKISSYSKRYNEQKHPETYEEIKNLPDGSLFAIRDSFVEGNRDKADIYKGSVTVLVNESTYSGASTFASAIKKSHAGKVLGETGCPTVYFGNYMSFTLPNSRLEYYISLNKFYE